MTGSSISYVWQTPTATGTVKWFDTTKGFAFIATVG